MTAEKASEEQVRAELVLEAEQLMEMPCDVLAARDAAQEDPGPRPTWSGCCSATSSMSIPPMSLNSISGCFAVPSQTTPA